jgi:hypothetical protein
MLASRRWLALCVAMGAAACDGDTHSEARDAGQGGAGGAEAAAAPPVALDGSAQDAGKGEDGGVPVCAPDHCTDSAVFAGPRLKGCCVDQHTCGVMLSNPNPTLYAYGYPEGCVEQRLSAREDLSCPSAESCIRDRISQVPVYLKQYGCRRLDGSCGVDFGGEYYGRAGCISGFRASSIPDGVCSQPVVAPPLPGG